MLRCDSVEPAKAPRLRLSRRRRGGALGSCVCACARGPAHGVIGCSEPAAALCCCRPCRGELRAHASSHAQSDPRPDARAMRCGCGLPAGDARAYPDAAAELACCRSTLPETLLRRCAAVLSAPEKRDPPHPCAPASMRAGACARSQACTRPERRRAATPARYRAWCACAARPSCRARVRACGAPSARPRAPAASAHRRLSPFPVIRARACGRDSAGALACCDPRVASAHSPRCNACAASRRRAAACVGGNAAAPLTRGAAARARIGPVRFARRAVPWYAFARAPACVLGIIPTWVFASLSAPLSRSTLTTSTWPSWLAT